MALTSDFNASGNVAFSRMRMLLQETALQEGVYGTNDLKVVQRGAGANMSVDVGAGAAWVQVDTGTRNGLAHCYNDATANVVVTASSGSNPRIDQIVLRFNDTTIPTGSGNVPTLECLAGTATVGATLDNRTGAAALPSDCLRLADILVPTSSTTVTTANIRDRRPWARGAFAVGTYTGANLTTSSGSSALTNSALQFRLELGANSVLVTARGRLTTTTGGAAINVVAGATGTSPQYNHFVPSIISAEHVVFDGITAPGAGSHLWRMEWNAITGGNTQTFDGAFGVQFTVREIVAQNTNNGTT